MKTKWFSILRYNKFTFGEQIVSQFVFFECKFLFSIILFYFHKTNGSQDRYHTHAFNAFSIKLFGQYTEYVLENQEPLVIGKFRRLETFKVFKKNSYHKIGNSNGCMTILFSGPWDKVWKEFKDGKTTYYRWGRNKK